MNDLAKTEAPVELTAEELDAVGGAAVSFAIAGFSQPLVLDIDPNSGVVTTGDPNGPGPFTLSLP